MVNVVGSVVPMADHVRLLGVTLDNACRWTSMWTKSVAHVFTTYVHCDIFDQPSLSAMPTWLPAQSLAHGSTKQTPCCTEHHLRTLMVVNTSKMRWLDASWTRKLIGAWMRCYINYTISYRSDFKLAKLAFLARLSSTISYLNSLVARYLPSRTLRSQDTNLLAVPWTKTVFGSRAFCVTASTVFNSLPQDIRSTDNISTFCRLLKTFYFRNAFN